MPELPEYAERNRAAWTEWSPEWVEPGRRAWSREEIVWGMWNVPEREIGALGDLGDLAGKDTIELGCGTAYFSAWLARHGARAVGIDVTAAQLETARGFQREFGVEFPLIEGNAEEVPRPNASFDLAISEYGASIWCDPDRWVPEAARLLRPGGRLVFLRNSTLNVLCMPASGPATTQLQRDLFGMKRLEWEDDTSVEFHLPFGEMLRLLRRNDLQLEGFWELQCPENEPPTRFEYITNEWARRWPSEEIWALRKAGM